MATKNVPFVRPELKRVLDLYEMIRDCLGGSKRVKSHGAKYLPVPNQEDKSQANVSRYVAYLQRAHFWPATRRTLTGLVGQVFARDPVIDIPDALKPMIEDINGASLSFIQQAKKALKYAIAYSRLGCMVDFPDTDGATVAEVAAGEVRPIIRIFAPWQVVNWREETRNSKTFYTLVVIAENYCVADDGFEIKKAGQFRVLRLDGEGNYVQEIWKERLPGREFDEETDMRLHGSFELHKTYVMKGQNGQPLKEILFSFAGSENNDSAVDDPNFADIADTNIAHYRNSADYEEAAFMTGQPTPVMNGLTKAWVDDVLQGKPILLGSRAAVPLPVGGDMKLVCAEEKGMLKEAMESKERMLKALGAKFLEQRDVQRTATEANIDESNDTSILASCANNISALYVWAFTKAGELVGSNVKPQVKLNNDFNTQALTPEQQDRLLAQWQQGAITYPEMRTGLKRAGTATMDDDEAKKMSDAETKAKNNETIRVANESKPPKPTAG